MTTKSTLQLYDALYNTAHIIIIIINIKDWTL